MNAPALQVEKGRLIVLVPECLVSNMDLMNRIYQMATREQREVFYLALVDEDDRMLAATRSLATLKALVNGGKLCSASQVVETSHWLAALGEIYRPGDIIVCHEEQQVRSGLLRTVPASEVIQARLHAPVCTVAGFYHPEHVQLRLWLSKLAYWAGLLVIIGAFFFLEIRLDQGIHGAARSLLLIFLLLVSLGVGIVWNKISSQ